MLVSLIWLVVVACAVADQPHFLNSSKYDGAFLGQYPLQHYHTEETIAPRLNVIRPFTDCDDGSHIFICPRGKAAPSGPLILDANGSLVWTSWRYPNAYNLRVQNYRGAPHLTFWVGNDQVGGHGDGEYVVLDQRYREIRRIHAGHGLHADLHEFLITEQNTALISIYNITRANLSMVSRLTAPGYIWDSFFQEIDLESGNVLFEWRASDHFGFTDSYVDVENKTGTEEFPWDWYHINSVEKDAAGNYLVSSRYLHHVAYLNGKTGEVEWTLGGKNSSFTDPKNTTALAFSDQHDARWHDGHKVMTLFDNGANYDVKVSEYSRGMRILIDEEAWTATLQTEYIHPLKILSTSQGSMQTLPNGNVLLGYGYSGAVTEFDGNGTVLCDVRFEPAIRFKSGDVQNYRAMKQNWTGLPDWPPKVAYYGDALYVSWLGSTDVRAWLLQTSDHADADYYNVLSAPKHGFETAIAIADVRNLAAFIRVVAQDAGGVDIGTSIAMNLTKAKDKFLAEEMARARDTISVLLASAVILIGAITVIVAACTAFGRHFTKWLLRRNEEDDDDDDDSDDNDSDFYNDGEKLEWRWSLPWSRARNADHQPIPTPEEQLVEELEMRQRRAIRDDSLELSDTDVSDDEH